MTNLQQKKLSELASEAIQVQDACNLTGVLRSAHEAAQNLMRHPDCQGTDWVNTHPIMVLYAEQIKYLAEGSFYEGSGMPYAKAYQKCMVLVENKE